jgi:glycosyltransferase involved in cell wall biosynthesis
MTAPTSFPSEPAVAAPDEARWKSRGRIFLVIRLLGARSGGAERLYCEMANMFAEVGYDVTCLYCDSSHEPPFYPLSPKVARINLHGKTARTALPYRILDGLARGYPKRKVRAPFDWLAKNLYFTRRLYAAARLAEPDVIISFMPPSNTPSLIAAALAGAKAIPTNHNVPAEDYRSPVRWDQNPIDRFLRLWTLHAAERVHVIFPTFAGWFPDRLQKKITPIPNYVSPDFADVEMPAARSKVILGVGRLAPVKNYRMLIDAWGLIGERHPDWKVRIYGIGPQRRELEARIRELGLVGKVELMGHEANMRRVYLDAEILAHPALFEGFGLSVAEALACGLPVVAFADCAGTNEFVHDGDNGLLVDRAGGAEALAAGLDRLIGDEGLRGEIRQRAPESMKAYSYEAFRDRWCALVDEVITGAPPS